MTSRTSWGAPARSWPPRTCCGSATRSWSATTVAFDGVTLAFCEVKTRRAGGRAGGPFDAVGRDKQARVRKMAGSWLLERRDRPYADVIRFDAIGVTVDGGGRLISLEHLEGAF